MQDRQIRQIGEKAFLAMIRHLKTSHHSSATLLGFDTEYVSKTGSYLSTQLATAGAARIWDIDRHGRITVDRLARWIRELEPDATEVVLVSYFSLAELQFLPVKSESFGWREYGNSFDCSFFSNRYKMSIRVFDLARFFDRRGLASVAEAFGMKKLEWDTTRVRKSDLRSPKFREYAINDAILVYDIMSALREEFMGRGVDILCADTPARASSEVFRQEYVQEDLGNEHSRSRYAGMRAAWGGRAEAFHRGEFPTLYEYDLPSAYPTAAVQIGRFPTTRDWREIRSARGMSSFAGGFLHCNFAFPASELYPCIPTIMGGLMLYPLQGSEWITTYEVQFALECGAKIEILEGWGFRTGTTCLAEYMADIMRQRKKATGPRSVALKLLANSLIGKLAQRIYKVSADAIWKHHEETGESIESLMSLSMEDLQALGLPATISVGPCFMPEWNALITGYTRARLSRYVRAVGAVYCATDSVWTTRKHKPMYGAKLKRSGAGAVYRSRLGYIGEHYVHHAIHSAKAARRILTDPEGDMSYMIRRPLKLRESLARAEPVGTWVEESRVASLDWDGKRHLCEDGTTRPLRTAEEAIVFRKDQSSANHRSKRK